MNRDFQRPEFCPQCPKQCPVFDLRCERGRGFFAHIAEGRPEPSRSPHPEFGPWEGRGSRPGFGPHPEHAPWGEHRPHHPRFQRPEINEESSLETLLRACGHRLHRGMPGSQDQMLKILAAQGEPVDQRALQEAMRIRPASASELLSKLEEKGWILRERDMEDRRRARVSLTAAGAEKAAEAANTEQTAEADLFAVLTEEEQQTLHDLLLKLLGSWK